MHISYSSARKKFDLWTNTIQNTFNDIIYSNENVSTLIGIQLNQYCFGCNEDTVEPCNKEVGYNKTLL